MVQPLGIGVVRTIAVKERRHVRAGDLLLELDSTASGADADRIRQELTATRLEATRLKATVLPLASTPTPARMSGADGLIKPRLLAILYACCRTAR